MVKTVAAIALLMAFALGVYWLLLAIRPKSGLISFSFLLVLPAVVSAFVAFVADPWAERKLAFYLMVPVWIMLAACGTASIFLREGVICILILSPLWVGSGAAGAWVTWLIRSRIKASRTYCVALLVLPLLAMQAEPFVPLPTMQTAVTRSVVIDAPPERIWPLLRGIPDVHPDEGQWNLSQGVIGLPRPEGARLTQDGIGAERIASWTHHIRFRERITQWQPERRIAWRFIFDDLRGWDFTDTHLRPDSDYFRVTTGGYSLQPLADGRSRLTLDTHYWIRTPVNHYSTLWGEFFLGDVENNLLALVKQRAERNGQKS